MRNDKENVIVTKSFSFALEIVKFSKKIEDAKKFVIARQVLKSGISIGANVREAQNAIAKQISFIKLKLLRRKLMKQSIGFYYANYLIVIPMMKGYIRR